MGGVPDKMAADAAEWWEPGEERVARAELDRAWRQVSSFVPAVEPGSGC